MLAPRGTKCHWRHNNMHTLLDILASGIHDAKNQLFQAESMLLDTETRHGIDLSEARYTIEAAAGRLTRTLTAYRLGRHEQALSIVPVVVNDLCDEVALAQRHHLASAQLALEVDCQVIDVWPLDRDLLTDILNNAVQNAGRHAKARVRLSALADDGGLLLTVEDDGDGFASPGAATGTGLRLAETLADLHIRKGRHGHLRLDNNSSLGGARFSLWLP